MIHYFHIFPDVKGHASYRTNALPHLEVSPALPVLPCSGRSSGVPLKKFESRLLTPEHWQRNEKRGERDKHTPALEDDAMKILRVRLSSWVWVVLTGQWNRTLIVESVLCINVFVRTLRLSVVLRYRGGKKARTKCVQHNHDILNRTIQKFS